MAFTKQAYSLNYVKLIDTETMFSDFPNGNYRATGSDVDGRRIVRNYTVNDMKDAQSKWSMWHDFNGRWGLNHLWHITDSGKKILIYRKRG